ncbi:MAG: NUDIX domain-containing protein [Cyanobacteria bacterium HKST-UBA02]|nr:NUDIX domain-containing protein [Cyanobacteria bacterium HKST-UBA02]
MRQRPSSRLLVLDPEQRLLLFRFSFEQGALAGSIFWATPGGAVDEGETFEEAAVRELFEETGIKIDSVNEHIAEREFILPMSDGQKVLAKERFYVVRVEEVVLSNENYTEEEHQVMTEHRWWHHEELRITSDTVFPEDLADILLSTVS